VTEPDHPADVSDLSDIVIVGAGPAGLAVAACLKRRGLHARLLERGEVPGWSWARQYESLRLHTSRSISALPGLPLRSATPYADRPEVLAYLAAYVRTFGLDIEHGWEVTDLVREREGWRIDTPRGPCHARQVVLATGAFTHPREPDWPGRDLFRGRWLNPQEAGASCAGRRVLIVGLGNTAADLIADLHGHGAQAALSVRGAVHVLPREVLGLNLFRWRQWFPERARAIGRRLGFDGEAFELAAARAWSRLQERRFGDLRRHGLALKSLEQIHHDQTTGLSPTVAGPWVDLIRRGEVPVFPGIERMTADGAVFTDGRSQAFDDVVLAIGYTESRFPLAGELPVPLRDGPVPGQPGLWICGAAPVLWRIGRSAERVAGGVAGQQRNRGHASPARR
jgi:cation diffusion facilitator CzcD-associated flavoprotein CzcO